MKVLICHETSGRVREEFRALGHEAWSCDRLPSEDGSPYHLQGDVFAVLARFPVGHFGLIGFHPSRTFLCGSGLHWNNRGRGWAQTDAALEDVRRLMARPEPWYLENPVGIIGTRIRPADQTIQPYEFGEDASKRTCLWLNKLPVLVKDPAQRVAGRSVEWPLGRMAARFGQAGGAMGEPDRQRTESASAERGPVEGAEPDLRRNCSRHGRAMGKHCPGSGIQSPTDTLHMTTVLYTAEFRDEYANENHTAKITRAPLPHVGDILVARLADYEGHFAPGDERKALRAIKAAAKRRGMTLVSEKLTEHAPKG